MSAHFQSAYESRYLRLCNINFIVSLYTVNMLAVIRWDYDFMTLANNVKYLTFYRKLTNQNTNKSVTFNSTLIAYSQTNIYLIGLRIALPAICSIIIR